MQLNSYSLGDTKRKTVSPSPGPAPRHSKHIPTRAHLPRGVCLPVAVNMARAKGKAKVDDGRVDHDVVLSAIQQVRQVA